jgi:ribosomal protein L11 methyltransferase
MFASSIKHRSAKSWHKITIQVDLRLSEAVAAYVAELTGTGLEITSDENSQVNTDRIFPQETVTAYIPIPLDEPGRDAAAKKIGDLRQFLAQVWHFFPDCPAPALKTETIMEEDWGEKWKSFFTALEITPMLTIKPSWQAAAEVESGGLVIEMDPGLAFGTGHHASTQLALLLLEELFQHRGGKELEKILDVGTGSGILAMACGLYGAKEVLALDNDPDALETAKQNVLRNRLESRITVSGQKVSSLKADFELIVANITHDILAEHAKLLASHIKPHGFLVLSGILKGDQEHSIRTIYARQGLTYVKNLSKDEWVALLFQKT